MHGYAKLIWVCQGIELGIHNFQANATTNISYTALFTAYLYSRAKSFDNYVVFSFIVPHGVNSERQC